VGREFAEAREFKEALKGLLSAAGFDRYKESLVALAEKNGTTRSSRPFCSAHPQTGSPGFTRRRYPYDIRREHRKFRCNNAAELVQFLADNFHGPLRSTLISSTTSKQFKNGAVSRQSPEAISRCCHRHEPASTFLRTRRRNDFRQSAGFPDDCDPFLVARLWYGLCPRSASRRPMRRSLLRTQTFGTARARARAAKHAKRSFFRSAPARAQTFIAERLQEEGWYDDELFTLKSWFQRGLKNADQPIDVGFPPAVVVRGMAEGQPDVAHTFGVAKTTCSSASKRRRNKQRMAEKFPRGVRANQAKGAEV